MGYWQIMRWWRANWLLLMTEFRSWSPLSALKLIYSWQNLLSLWQLILWLKKGISKSNRLNITEKPYIYLSVSLPPILSVTDGMRKKSLPLFYFRDLPLMTVKKWMSFLKKSLTIYKIISNRMINMLIKFIGWNRRHTWYMDTCILYSLHTFMGKDRSQICKQSKCHHLEPDDRNRTGSTWHSNHDRRINFPKFPWQIRIFLCFTIICFINLSAVSVQDGIPATRR